MYRTHWRRAALPILAFLAAVSTGVDAAPNPELVGVLVEDLLEVTGLPGFSVAVLDESGEIWAAGYGFADAASQRSVNAETSFRAASVSKILTVTALARLVQAGELDFDATLEEVGVEFADPTGGISARSLAGHLAGIAHYQPADKRPSGKHYDSVTESLEVFRDSPRVAEPGQQYTYSTHGYTLLSAMIEKAAAKPFLQLLRDELFMPLEMTGSGPDLRPNPPAKMATLYNVVGRKTYVLPPALAEDPSYKWAGGGLVSTPTDLMRLARAYYGDFLRDDIRAEMWTTQKVASGKATGVGIGWRIGEGLGEEPIRHHAGSMAGARSVVLLQPERRRAISTMTNGSWRSSVERSAEVLLEAYFRGRPRTDGEARSIGVSGSFGDEATSTRMDLEGGRGSIETPEALRTLLRRAAVDELPLHHLHDDLWALVTPFGLAALTLRERDSGEIEGEVALGSQLWTFRGVARSDGGG